METGIAWALYALLLTPFGVLTYFFGRKGAELYRKNKKLQSIIAFVCSGIAVCTLAAQLIGCFVKAESQTLLLLWGLPVLCALLFVGFFFAQKVYRRFTVIGVLSIGFIWFSTLWGYIPSDPIVLRDNVEYNIKEDLEVLLNTDLPPIRYEKATQSGAATTVYFSLPNSNNKKQLENVRNRLKAYCPNDWLNNSTFDVVDTLRGVATEVVWKEEGLTLTYSPLYCPMELELRRLLHETLPDYQFISMHNATASGRNWNSTDSARIKFNKPLSTTWLDSIKAHARKEPGWTCREDQNGIYIKFVEKNTEEATMTIYKDKDNQCRTAKMVYAETYEESQPEEWTIRGFFRHFIAKPIKRWQSETVMW